MAPIQTVALAGATGNLGKPVLDGLLEAGFHVTALTRVSSTSGFPSSVKVARVDYENVDQLTEALKGHDALVSTITTKSVQAQEKLVDAAIAAGVKRIIPSEFGCDTTNERTSKLPVYYQKVAIQQYIEEKTKGTGTSYTYIMNNAFLDWGVAAGSLIKLKDRQIDLYDGGDVPFSATTLATIARAVVGVLKHPDETVNRAVRVHDMILTQNQLLKAAQDATGKEGWKVNEKSTEATEKEAWESFQTNPGNFSWIFGFLVRAIYGGRAFGNAFPEEDNKLLGLGKLEERDLVEIVRKAI